MMVRVLAARNTIIVVTHLFCDEWLTACSFRIAFFVRMLLTPGRKTNATNHYNTPVACAATRNLRLIDHSCTVMNGKRK